MSDVDDGETYPRSPIGLTDAGAERETRVRPCPLRTWCMLEAGHETACCEAPRRMYPRPAWDLATPDPSHWRELRPKLVAVAKAAPAPPAPAADVTPTPDEARAPDAKDKP